MPFALHHQRPARVEPFEHWQEAACMKIDEHDLVSGYDRQAEAARIRAAQAEVASTRFSTEKTCLVLLTVIAVVSTLYFAAAIVLPFLVAIVLNLLLAPMKRFLTDRMGLPAVLASLLLVIVLFSILVGVGTAIYLPASSWIARVPQSLPTLEERLSFLHKPLDLMQRGLAQMETAMHQTGPDGATTMQVTQATNTAGVGFAILSGTKDALNEIVVVVVTLFFLLTAGDGLLRNLVEILPTFRDKRRAVEINREIQSNISAYLTTITLMNLLVGLAATIGMWAMGMPNPLLWGALAFMLNYIPILGPITGVVIFFFVGLFSSDAIIWAIAPAAMYLVIHVIEGESVTPMLLARRFTLNPVLVIMSLFFWDWLWGVPGAVLAMPLMATTKIICDRIPGLMPLGHLLGGGEKQS
jgi:predicted PurR-regulated permease PerM